MVAAGVAVGTVRARRAAAGRPAWAEAVAVAVVVRVHVARGGLADVTYN